MTDAAPGSLRTAISSGYARVLGSHKVQSCLRTTIGVETSDLVAALTFDDGPDPTWTAQVLDQLARLDVRATFFLLGRHVAARPDLVRRIVDEGHGIGNHTFSHPCLADCSPGRVARELGACQRAIRAAAGRSTSLMRPPFGAQRVDTFVTARALGYDVIHWSASAQDWLGHDANTIASRVLSDIGPGGIVLMHDNWQPPPPGHTAAGDPAVLADRRPTIEALPLVVHPLREQGYRFVTVSDLLTLGPPRRKTWFWT